MKAAYYKIRYLKNAARFKGKNVYCPCCDKQFSRFQDYVPSRNSDKNLYVGTSLAVVCPSCASLPRHRIVCDYLDKHQPPSSSKVLLFAPTYGLELWFKRHGIRTLYADLFNRVADVKVDIQKIPFEDNTFDFISCDHVLEHVPDYMLGLRELCRVIKLNGVVEITVPIVPSLAVTYEDPSITSPFERIAAFGQDDHLRSFGMDFSEKLKSAGFDVTVVDGDACDPKIVPLTAPGTSDSNKIFICTKRV